ILSGTYSNTLLFTAAANPPYVGYTLKFNPNIDGAGGSGSGSDIASNMPATMTETVMATSYKFTVPSTVPTRPGYRFIGWSKVAAHTMGTPNPKDNGSGTDNLYVAGDKIEVVAEDMSDLSDVKAEATIYAIWANEYTYTITYNCNSGSGCPSNFSTSEITSSYTYTISSTEPTRTNYNFTGYLGSDGTTYQAGANVALSSSKLSVTLTAQWEQSAPAFFTITYMQDMTPSVCDSVTTPAISATTSDTTGAYNGNTSYVPETTLIDYRGTDGTGTASSPATGSNKRTYTVRKLADGNCWMAENLKLTLTNNQSVLVGTFSGGETSWTPTGDGAGNDYNEAINANTKADVNGGNWYYPWYAATAGQGAQTSNPTISQSICPKGWKLPNGGANTAPSFQSIVDTYSATTPDKIKAAPLSYTAVGSYYSGSPANTSYGYYWSASPYTSTSNYAYGLRFTTSSVGPQGNSSNYRGFSVRCVAIP
ncbi:InlB B-repeat-containing protein, partial [Candidatus Saccharibacteria bacterium]|nr:InlB B-repeat-containing protein [Candidatus Saccharibacteria bacterium]